MKTNISEPKDVVKASISALNNLLADEFVLLAKSWNFHWNVKGPSFGSYHSFLEKIYIEAFNNIDNIAERIRAINGRPIGSLKGALEHNRIKEEDEHKPLPSSLAMFKILLEDYETVIREVKTDLKNLESKDPIDEGTLSFLQSYIEKTEKTCWMLRAHLDK